jgi:hypothetical protein
LSTQTWYKVFHNVSRMSIIPARRLLKLGFLCPKPFNGSWIIVAYGSQSEELDAIAPSESERDWLERSQRPPRVRDYWHNRYIYIYMLNGTKWRLLLGEDMGGSRCHLMEGQKTLSCYKPSWTEGLTKDDTGGSQTEPRNVPRTRRRAHLPLFQVDPHSYSRVT